MIRFKNVFNPHFEKTRHFERQRQAWVIFFRLDRVNRLARNLQPVRQIRLGPLFRRAQFAQTIFQLYLRYEKIAPIP